MIYGSWDTEWGRQNFLSFWGIFCPFSPLTTWKIKRFTFKRTPGDIINLHVGTIYDNHVLYGCWNMKRIRQFFCHSGPFFALYTPMDQENQDFEKIKKPPEDIIISQMCTINDGHIMYGSWDMECNGHNFLSFWAIFCPFNPPMDQKNQNFWKNNKNPWRYYHFTQVYYKWQSYDVWFMRHGARRTDVFVILGPIFGPLTP